MARTKSDAYTKAAVKAPRKAAALGGGSSKPGVKANKNVRGNSYCPRPVPSWQKPITSFFSEDGSKKDEKSQKDMNLDALEFEGESSAAEGGAGCSHNIDAFDDEKCSAEPECIMDEAECEANYDEKSADDAPSAESELDGIEKCFKANKNVRGNSYFPRPVPSWQKPITSFFSEDGSKKFEGESSAAEGGAVCSHNIDAFDDEKCSAEPECIMDEAECGANYDEKSADGTPSAESELDGIEKCNGSPTCEDKILSVDD